MADTTAATYQLIMEKVPEERQPDAALFLSGCFSLPPASTRGIAASGPIALLSDLTKQQAEAIFTELEPSLPDGVDICVVDGSGRSRVSRLQWPRPPRIYGSPLGEFIVETESHETKCPVCGGMLKVTQDGNDIRITAASPTADKRRSGETAVRPRPSSDRDPLFSGVKPLAQETSKYASIRSLQAGDTGFWMDHTSSIFSQPDIPEATPARTPAPGGTSNAKKSTGRVNAGLAAFMQPGSFAVVLGRSRDAQVIKMVSEIMGLSESEAREKSSGLGLCVAKDISLDEAQNLLARFRNLGARARIIRPS